MESLLHKDHGPVLPALHECPAKTAFSSPRRVRRVQDNWTHLLAFVLYILAHLQHHGHANPMVPENVAVE